MTKIKNAVLAAIVSVLAITGANAQNTFKKSDKILEGTVAYSKSTGTDAEYAFSPSVGYFLTNMFAVGITADLGKSADGNVTNLGAYGRCYFMNVGQNLKVYSQLGLASNTIKIAEVKESEFAAGIGLGVNYFVSKKIALSANVSDLVSYTSADGASNFSIGFTGINNPIAMGKFGILVKL